MSVLAPGGAELVYDCVVRDPRWDHQTEARGWYLSRLVVAMDLSLAPIAAHLAEPVAAEDDDEWRVALALHVLGDLVRRGRADAVEGSPVVLDLAEEPSLRTALGALPGLPQALRALGPAAVDRARRWIGGTDGLLDRRATDVLAEHGDATDAPALAALQRAADIEDWCGAETPARGLGRLGVTEAAPTLRRLWEETVHSYARTDYLAGLLGAAPHDADRYVEEALDDCEANTRAAACRAAHGAGKVTKVRELLDDPIEETDVRDAARQFLAAD